MLLSERNQEPNRRNRTRALPFSGLVRTGAIPDQVRPSLENGSQSFSLRALEFEFAVAGINHLNKKSDLAAMHRVAGARGWTSVARINFLVGRGENEVDGASLRHVCPLKLNLSADDRGSLDFTIKTRPVTDGMIIGHEYAYVNWKGRGAASADEITMAKPGKGSMVESWLRTFLKGALWVPAKDIHEAGKDEGFSRGQIKRGLEQIEAEWRRTATVPSITEWRLPVRSQSAQPEAEGG